MSQSCRILTLTLFLFAHAAAAAAATDVDILVQRLVDKGLLTEAEARSLIAEMSAARDAVPVQDLAQPAPGAGAVATATTWADKIDVKGDFRTRYQTEELDNAPTVGPIDISEQDRARIRWRLGTDAEVTDQWTVGFGLASGGSDPRSTNQTLAGAFSTGDVRLDYAYARYAATEQVEMLAGKFKNPLWVPKDLLWDSDIRPDGVAARITLPLGEHTDAFVTPAYLVLTEGITRERKDASMWVLQAGATFALGERTALTLVPTYYAFDNLRGTPGPISLSAPTNSRDADGNLLYDFDAVTAAANLTVNDVGPFAQASLFGEYVNALDPDDDNTGYMVGASLGDAKVSGFGDWQFIYNYRRLERDAWPEFLADSEALFGATNVRGNEVEFLWGLSKNVWIVADYYSNFEFMGTDIEQDLFHIDLNLKW